MDCYRELPTLYNPLPGARVVELPKPQSPTLRAGPRLNLFWRAVAGAMDQLGADPKYESSLSYYPADSGDCTIESMLNN